MLQNPQIQHGLHQKEEAMFTQKSCLRESNNFTEFFFFYFHIHVS